ncbi:MAG TPA: hypothetical protein VFN65_14435 [Solirubrobacteraceae bacterium]|nr:hypothetical protein [Solirubrobacteraceae bacterium]
MTTTTSASSAIPRRVRTDWAGGWDGGRRREPRPDPDPPGRLRELGWLVLLLSV